MSSTLRFAGISWVLAIAAVTNVRAAESPLRSPWDLHPVAASDASYTCPAAPQLPHDFETKSYYTDSHHSVTDPALKKKYEDSVAGIDDFSRAVVKAADAFQAQGSRAAAQCVGQLLESAAKQNALTGKMGGSQASYVRGWSLGAWSVAFLKVRGSRIVPEEQSKSIVLLLKKLAEENREYYEEKRRYGRTTDAYNNHLYWAGFAIAAAAIANDNHELFQWSMDAYKQGVHDIREDGTLPMEMDRGQMALHYHLYALAPLMMLAELGQANGIDLYGERDFAIKRLVARCISGLGDPSYFQQKTGVPQVTTPEIEPWEISWAQPYTRRFPDPKISALLSKASRLNFTMLGGLPPP